MDTRLDTHEIVSTEVLDLIETIISGEEYAYERMGDGELHFVAPGSWTDHELWFAWNSSIETLHLCLNLDAKTPPETRARLFELVALLNERMWLGHFDVWSEDQAIVFRCAVPLPDGATPSQAQIASMIAAALDAGERFYPAYNFLVWAGKAPSDAVTAAMFETAGEA